MNRLLITSIATAIATPPGLEQQDTLPISFNLQLRLRIYALGELLASDPCRTFCIFFVVFHAL
jgi:hypothetical protein